MQWRMIEQLDGATADAVEFAAARGWLRTTASHWPKPTDTPQRIRGKPRTA